MNLKKVIRYNNFTLNLYAILLYLFKTKNKYLMQSIFVQYIFCTYSVYFNRNLMNVDYRQNIWNQFNAYQLGFENFIESTFSTFERKLNQLYSFFIHIKL